MDVPSFVEAKYHVTFIDEAFGHTSTCPMTVKVDTTRLSQLYVCRVERQTNRQVKKIVLGCTEEHVKGTKTPEIDLVEACITAIDILDESVHAERIRRAVHNAIIKILQHSGASVKM